MQFTWRVTLFSFMLATSTLKSSVATDCLVCSSLESNENCNANGVLRKCLPYEVCESKITSFGKRLLITKRCTPKRHCSEICKGKICRTCCKYNRCNQDLAAKLPPSFSNASNGQTRNQANQKTERCENFLLKGVATRCLRLKAGNSAGTTCLFWCSRSDYVMQGPSRLTCVMTENGAVWSGNPPVCTSKAQAKNRIPGPCDPLLYDESILDMDCSNEFNFRSACTFRCKNGFYMVDPINYLPVKYNVKKSVCWRGTKEPSVWTRPPPPCMSKKCPVLVRVGNSSANCTDWIRVGSICDFWCFPGFNQIGPSTLKCLDFDPEGSYAAWNDTKPLCEPRECQELNISTDAMSTQCSDGNFYRSECRFVCAIGHYMTYQERSTPLPKNEHSSKCRVSNEDEMVWRPLPPTCIKKTCPDISILENGYVECTDDNYYMSSCSFFCDDAFLLAGVESLTCIEGPGGNTKFGAWDGRVPWCRPKVCEAPVYNIENTESTCTDGYSYGSICTYTCKVGYYMTASDGETFIESGRSEAECVISKERTIIWSIQSPLCHLKSCKELSDPENGLVSCSDGNNHASRCRFSCLRGYVLDGQRTLTCRDSAKPCPELLYDRSTTNVECTHGESYRSICTFTCKIGFYMPSPISDDVLGNSATVCILTGLETLQWSDPSPQCLLKTCTVLSDPENGNVECNDGENHNSVCSYSCNSGYEPDGMNKLTCSDDGYNTKLGVWDKTPPPCIKRSCPGFDIDLVSTGFMCDNEHKFESKCQFHCMEGHYMTKGTEIVDYASSVCGVSGDSMVWNESPPECKLKECPEIPTPERGILRCNNGFHFGSGCMTMCSPGFYLDGQRIIQCEDNGINDPLGSWDYEIPTCEKKSCPAHESPVTEILTELCDDGYLFESKCNYSCADGYYMEHRGFVTKTNKFQMSCGVSGRDMKWSYELPNCIIKTCPTEKRIPENGNATCTRNNTFESRCDFTCRRGFTLRGNTSSICESSKDNTPLGMWDSLPPICERRPCGEIIYDTTSLAMLCTNGQKFESVCTFTCQTGYYAAEEEGETLGSHANTTCSISNDDVMHWNNEPPICIKKTCEPRSKFMFGTISCTDELNYQTVCSYECLPGFRLVGDGHSTCVDNDPFSKFGQWTTEQPKCERRLCPDLEHNKETVTVNCTIRNLFESTCEFGCVHGYHMTSSTSKEVVDFADTQCDILSNEMYWTEPVPECVVKRCSEPRIPKDGEVKCDKENQFQSECTFSCSDFRKLEGSPTIQCNADDRNIPQGHWNATFPTCELRSCPDWNINSKAIVEKCGNFYKYGSTCTFLCNEGHYVPIQNRTGDAESTQAECGIQETVMTWTGRPPVCEVKTCQPLTAPINGMFNCSDGYSWDTKCTFQCNPGFLLIGEKVLRCEDDGLDGPEGIWNGVEPVCEARSCDELQYDTETQDVECSFGVKYGTICNIKCHVGYYMTAKNGVDLIDNATAICDVHPTNKREVDWDHDEPKCIIKKCPKPERPPDGLVLCKDGREYGKRCMYKCLPGFDMVGLSTTSCEDDGLNTPFGVWGKETPTCEPKSCARLVNNLNVTNLACTDGWKYRSVCTFSCNKGYFIIEGDGRTIVESGEKPTKCSVGFGGRMVWSADVPNCLSKYCLAIRSRKNMTMECTDDFKYNSRCTFRCDSPLKLVGPPVMTCIDDEKSAFSGKWDGKHWQLRCRR